MTNLLRRGVRALRRDGAGHLLARPWRRTARWAGRAFDDRVLGLARHVDPYLYLSLYRKVHGHDREINRLVRHNAQEIVHRSEGAARRLFVDCGVNEGVILARYRKALPGFDFVGFEIQTDVIEQARKVNPGVELRNAAVAAEIGEVEVFLVGAARTNMRGGTSILRPRGRTPQRASYRVPAIRFSDFLSGKRREGYDFIAVKMDIEGAEYQIIEDLHRIWQDGEAVPIDFLMIEFHPALLVSPGENDRYEALLGEMGIRYSTWL
jgi:FkbM family methyltransferase